MERSAAGSRRVRKTVAAFPRRESWATWPSTHTSPSRPIHSATLRATVRTGHGDSGEEGLVTLSRVPSRSPGSAGVPRCSRQAEELLHRRHAGVVHLGGQRDTHVADVPGLVLEPGDVLLVVGVADDVAEPVAVGRDPPAFGGGREAALDVAATPADVGSQSGLVLAVARPGDLDLGLGLTEAGDLVAEGVHLVVVGAVGALHGEPE